ncbi:MAG: hypothetical protein NVSMB48_19740 [Marmoricola sp.]
MDPDASGMTAITAARSSPVPVANRPRVVTVIVTPSVGDWHKTARKARTGRTPEGPTGPASR